ncbi:MAG: YbbR-like domain-containing protein [Acidobacteriota bacterium]
MNPKIKKLFTKNLGLKIFSLLLALILWFSLIPEEKKYSEKTLNVPLELHNIPSDIELIERPMPTVQVSIRAPERLINQITSANVHAVLDLRKASTAQQDYTLSRSMVSIPNGAEVKEISPSLVNLKFEKSKQLMLSIRPNLIGELPPGFILKKTEVEPPEVLVKGPESKLNENDAVRTSPINISDFKHTTAIEADLITPAPELTIVGPKATALVKLLIQKEESEDQTNKRSNE